MEDKMPISEPDSTAGPPLKKARYYWQVKGHKKLKENDKQLNSLQENDDTESEAVPIFPSELVPMCLSDVAEHENNSHEEPKQSLIQDTEDHDNNFSTIFPENEEVTRKCSTVGANISVCSVETSVTSDVSQDMVQDDHTQPVITSIESSVRLPINENTDNSCISLISSCDNSGIEHSCEVKANSLISGNRVSSEVDNSSNGRLSISYYENAEPGTSKDSIVEKADGCVSIPCDVTQDILALESSNTNFMDLIQTKVDIQARKLNLLNMVHNHTNSRQESTSQETTTTIPKKTHSSSADLPPITINDVLSSSGSAAHSSDHHSASEQPISVGQDSLESDLDVSGSSNPPEEPTFLSRWQSQHTAKAIVDNAINKTLEEMGLTPDVSTSAWNRLFLEDEGINEAIRFRGLWLRDSGIQSARIHPLISQITGASEQVFEQTLDNAAAELFRPVTRDPIVRNLSPPHCQTDVMDSGQSHHIDHLSLMSQTRQLDPCSEFDHLEASESNSEELDLMGSHDVREQTACDSDSASNDDNRIEEICADDPSVEAASAAADVLQFALNAAITSKGLSIRNDQAL